MRQGLAGGFTEANAERLFLEAPHPIYVDDMTEAFLRCRAALGGRGRLPEGDPNRILEGPASTRPKL
jgi:hypothetical protein